MMNTIDPFIPLERAPSALLKQLGKNNDDQVTASELQVLLSEPRSKFDAPSRIWLRFAQATLEKEGAPVPCREQTMLFEVENERPERNGSEELLIQARNLAHRSQILPTVVQITDLKHALAKSGRCVAITPAAPCGGKLKWKVNIGSPVHGSPTGDDAGSIYVGADDCHFYSFSADDGTQNWRFRTQSTFWNRPLATENGRVYVGTTGKMTAFHGDAPPQWDFPIKRSCASSAVRDENGILYFGGNDSTFYAVTPDGVEKWKFSAEGRIEASPSLGNDGSIYFADSSGSIYALDSNGKEKWRYSQGYTGQLAAPLVDDAGCVYAAGNGDFFLALDSNGKEKWRIPTGGRVFSSPIKGRDGLIYFECNDGKLYAVTLDGKIVWTFENEKKMGFESSPAIGWDKTIYIGCEDGHLYAITPDGKEKWKFKTEGGVRSSPFVDDNGSVYFGSKDGCLYALE